jgi:hypothetical protein
MISADDFVEVSPARTQEMRRIQRSTESARRSQSVANGHAIAAARSEIEQSARERGRAEAFMVLRVLLRDLDVEVTGSASFPCVVNHRADHPEIVTPALHLFRLRRTVDKMMFRRPPTRYEQFLLDRAHVACGRHGIDSEPHIVALVRYYEVRIAMAARTDAK